MRGLCGGGAGGKRRKAVAPRAGRISVSCKASARIQAGVPILGQSQENRARHGLRWQRGRGATAFWSGMLSASETSPRQKAVSAPCPSATAVQIAVAVPKVTVSTGAGGLQESEMRPRAAERLAKVQHGSYVFDMTAELRKRFAEIEPGLLRYPAIDRAQFKRRLETFLAKHESP